MCSFQGSIKASDFDIEPILEQFYDTVGPQIGTMIATTTDYIKRNKSVADTASSCAGALGGAYQSNNVGKAIRTYNNLSEGCKKIAEDGLQGKVIPILVGCQELIEMITELKQMQAKAYALIAQRDAAAAAEDNETAAAIEKQLVQLKAQFDAKQKEALAKLEELKGMPSDIPDMAPTNGSLSYQPNINVAAEKGSAGLNGQFKSYNMGDTRITSVQN